MRSTKPKKGRLMLDEPEIYLHRPPNYPLTTTEPLCQGEYSKVAETSDLAVSCVSNSENPGIISKMGWGGARANSGGARPGSGRKPNPQPEPARIPVGMRWYVAEALYLKTSAAIQSILEGDPLCKRKGYNAFLPTSPVRVKVRDGKKGPEFTTVPKPMFFQFLFVEFDVDHDPWEAIRYADGVKRLLMSAAGRPIPVPKGFVEGLIETAPERLNLPEKGLSKLQVDLAVAIPRGPFEGHIGFVEACDGYVTTVRLNLFNRYQSVRMRRCDISADE